MATQAKLKLLNPKKIKMSKARIFTTLTIAAFVGAFGSFFFVISAHIFAPGLAGLSNGISYTVNDIIWAVNANNLDWIPGWANSRAAADAIVYWIVYIILCIPVIWLGFTWFSKRFMFHSIYYLTLNLAFSMLFANAPSNWVDVTSLDEVEGAAKTVAIFIYAGLGGACAGLSVGWAFKVGACTMGLDPIAKKISRDKSINVSSLLAYISIVNTTMWTIVGASIPEFQGATAPIAQGGGSWITSTLLSPEYIASWIYIGTYSAIAGSIYSSTKKVEVFTTSDKTDTISEYLNSISYHRGHTIYTLEGGYTHMQRKALKMIVSIDEMYDVVEKIAAIDDKAFITVKELYRVYDIHNWTTMTDEDKEKERQRIIKKTEKRIKTQKTDDIVKE